MTNKLNQKVYWKKVAKSYNKLVNDTGDTTHRKVINPIVSGFLGDLKGKTILDAGCGNGYWSGKMAKEAKKVIGVDFTKELIDIARLKFSAPNLEFITNDLRRLNIPDNKFDVVLCNMALIDVDGLNKAVGEMARVLKTGGNLVISITHPCFENPPNTSSLKNKNGEKIGRLVKHYFETGVIKDLKQNWDSKQNYQHCHYTISDYFNTFSKHNLFVEKTSEPNWSEIMSEGYSHTPYFLIFRLKKITNSH
ncbi:MAG: class I SAM-dependent methyltransferase [Patescibacteria group bacterium]|nr:class I SAM-dependent methyltransferase [Patescibacteria group bacterium]